MKNSRVSVIMPAYNAGKYIREAIQSILNQTFTGWELIIVDDASTDDTLKIIETFKDPRIKIIRNEQNLGSVVSRNIAFARIQSEYVAILDADDISMPTRLAEQVRFLDSHPDFGLVASWAKIIDENGRQIGHVVKDTTPPEKIPLKLLFHNVLAFSSVMMRKSAMPPIPFEENSVPVEDVALYLKMVPNWKFAGLQRVLISYRSHEKGISKVYGAKKQGVMDRLISGELKKFGIEASPEELKIHRTNFGYGGRDIEEFIRKREAWLRKLVEQNRQIVRYPSELFAEVVAEKWLQNCDANARLGLKLWKIFRQSPLSKEISWRKNFKKLLRLWVKCLLAKDTLAR